MDINILLPLFALVLVLSVGHGNGKAAIVGLSIVALVVLGIRLLGWA